MMSAPIPIDDRGCNYDDLPPAVRRKYFSTLERLRLAQDAATGQTRSYTKSRLNTGRISRPRTSSSNASRRPGTSHTTSRRLRKPQAAQDDFLQEQSDATWFLALPEKVRRDKFTREEQVLYSGRCESILLDAADEALYKISRASRSATSLVGPPANRTSFFIDADADDEEGEESDMDQSDNRSIRLGEEVEDSLRWMGEEHGLEQRLQLDDYHRSVIETAPTSTTERWKKAAYRRTLSLTSNPFGRSGTSTDGPPTPGLSGVRPAHSRKPSKSFSGTAPRHLRKNSATAVESEATHYQDPEARLKLRTYLASNQKFDEALEFGFPSTDAGSANRDVAPQLPHLSYQRSGTAAPKRSADVDASNFLRDGDQCSLFEDSSSEDESDDMDGPEEFDETLEEEDAFSLSDASAPITPASIDMAFRHPHRLPGSMSSKSNSADSAAAQHLYSLPSPASRLRPTGNDAYVHSLAGNREMTMRMTLTRPDLRADESQIYGWQNNSDSKTKSDPLAMEALPAVAELPDGIRRGPLDGPDGWGPLEKETGFKKLWHRVRKA